MERPCCRRNRPAPRGYDGKVVLGELLSRKHQPRTRFGKRSKWQCRFPTSSFFRDALEPGFLHSSFVNGPRARELWSPRKRLCIRQGPGRRYSRSGYRSGLERDARRNALADCCSAPERLRSQSVQRTHHLGIKFDRFSSRIRFTTPHAVQRAKHSQKWRESPPFPVPGSRQESALRSFPTPANPAHPRP